MACKSLNGLVFPAGLRELLHLIATGSLDGNCAETVTVPVLLWLPVATFNTGPDVDEAAVKIGPDDVMTAGLVEGLDAPTATLLFMIVTFDECDVVVVNAELFTAVVTTLVQSTLLLPKPAPGLKSLELLTIVAKLGKGLCSTEILVGTL